MVAVAVAEAVAAVVAVGVVVVVVEVDILVVLNVMLADLRCGGIPRAVHPYKHKHSQNTAKTTRRDPQTCPTLI